LQGTPKVGRQKLHAIHTWVGFHLAAIMFIVLLTGSTATISHEIDWLFQHDMRVEPDGEKVSWGKMHDAVKTHRPNSTIIAPYGRHRSSKRCSVSINTLGFPTSLCEFIHQSQQFFANYA